MSNQNGYIGRSPGDSAVIIASQTFEPTGIQTDFTFASGYDPGYIDVYFNGARLVYANDYTATNGSTVGLTTYANNGDVLELVAYKAFNVASVSEATGNFTVGNQLTVSGLTTAADAFYTGIVTATSFSGDGSSLTGLANTDVINTENINVIGVATVGSAVTINSTGIDAVSGVITAATFKGALIGNASSATALQTGREIGGVIFDGTGNINLPGVNQSGTQNTSGTAAGLSGTPDITINNITGVAATFTGVLTYEDVTNVDSVGIVTARGGLEVGAAGVGGTISSGGNVIFAGITTVGTALSLADNVRAKFGDSGDLSIYHDASNSYIHDEGTGGINLKGSFVKGLNGSNEVLFNAIADGAVELYHNNVKTFETQSSGILVQGPEGGAGQINLHSDEGDDNADKWRLTKESGNSSFRIQNYTSGSWETNILATGDGAVELYNDASKKFETYGSGTLTTGITSTTQLTVGPGLLQESFDPYSSALTGTLNHDVLDHGMVLHAATNASASFVINLRGDGSTTFNSLMNIGQSSVFTVYSASNNASYYLTDFQIDGSSITEKWSGGTAPSAGSGAGVDVYTFNILKTANATFSVYANTANFA